MAHRSPGPAPQVEKREECLRLIARGVPIAEACRIVGINRRTDGSGGRTWTPPGDTLALRPHNHQQQREVVAYAPVISTPAPEVAPRDSCPKTSGSRSPTCAGQGTGVRDIAARTGRSPATISRELCRNHDPEAGRYRPFAAHRHAVQRRARRRPGKIAQVRATTADPHRRAIGREPRLWTADPRFGEDSLTQIRIVEARNAWIERPPAPIKHIRPGRRAAFGQSWVFGLNRASGFWLAPGVMRGCRRSVSGVSGFRCS